MFVYVCVCCAYIGWEPVGRRGLVDVVVVVVCVGAALRGLPLPSANRAALHHAAADLRWRFLRGSVRVTVFCHHSVEERKLSSSNHCNLFVNNNATFAFRCWKGSAYPLRLRNHQAPSMRPPAQPPWLRVSQEIRFWGDSWGVMWPIDWMEILSEATASEEKWPYYKVCRPKAFYKNI